MYTEYCNYSRRYINYKEEIKTVFEVLEHGVDGIATTLGFLKKNKEFLPCTMTIACPVGYPLGNSPSKIKQAETLYAINAGCNAIDFVANCELFLNRKFKQFIDEILVHKKICEERDISFRVMIEQSLFTSSELQKVAISLHSAGIDLVHPTVGYHHDDSLDHAIACSILQKNEVRCIYGGYLFSESQMEIVPHLNPYGIRFFQLPTLKLGVYNT